MQKPAVPLDETQRLRALRSLNILDTYEEPCFDRITRLAAYMFNVPIALVSLVDQNRQWFKSRQGLEVCESGRDISFCGHAILHELALIVPDARQDQRFHDNPLVTGPPYIRFYAGNPVHAADGSRIGTLCIIDRVSRRFSEADVVALSDLAGMVDRELSLLRLATIDELTHLSNSRGFLEIAEHVLALCRRNKQPVAVIAIDLDGFKAINDTCGHAAGDQVLRQFGTLLLKQFRASDVIARLGGDEFAVFAPGATDQSILVSLEQLGERFQNSELAQAYPGLSWSVGIAECHTDTDATLPQLMRVADKRMYDFKRKSGDRRRSGSR